ncbi:hypothetical protein H4217_002276 [Coemansia sp. RSA 1939]|nr:hypothetical protein H4217_002276 [Coemansia sp. RSA 1939]
MQLQLIFSNFQIDNQNSAIRIFQERIAKQNRLLRDARAQIQELATPRSSVSTSLRSDPRAIPTLHQHYMRQRSRQDFRYHPR